MPIQSRRECALAHRTTDPVIAPAMPRRRVSTGAVIRRPGRSPNLSPRLNRRELLVAGSAVGAVMAAAAAVDNQAEAGVELGRYARRSGVQGKMTGAQAAAAALRARACPASSEFRAPRTTSSGTRSRPGRFPICWSPTRLRPA